MSNYQTLKNSLKKLENKQQDTEKKPNCGVVFQDEFEMIEIPDVPLGRNRCTIGYLVVPRPLTMEQWDRKYG
jgi:hypothetical protein